MKLLKHKNMTDVAIRIVRTYDEEVCIEWLVDWWNVVGEPYQIGLREKIEISNPDDWKEME